MTALNTLGGIAGALLTGILFLPRFGMQTSITITTGIFSGGSATKSQAR